MACPTEATCVSRELKAKRFNRGPGETLSLCNWLSNSQQCKSREELGTKLPHNCSLGYHYSDR